MKSLTVVDKNYTLPIFLPDATRGVVRSLDSKDLISSGVEGLVVNTYHLMSEPGLEVLKKIGGIKKMMNFDGLIISDSGGFQLLSLVHKDKKLGKVSDEGVVFYLTSTGGKTKIDFTPETSIQVQFDLGADILICLDDCPAASASEKEVWESVERTIKWAKRCKDEFEKQVKNRKLTKNQRPQLFGVIQGGDIKEARKYCAEELLKIGFDGYGFGGWPMKDGKLNEKILKFTASLMPDALPKYALGVGDSASVIKCFKMGYIIFDCVLPTRDARHHRLYVFDKDPATVDLLKDFQIGFLYINKSIFAQDSKPVSSFCDCLTCQNYSRAYLYHLFKIGDSLAWRLATLHNLRTYTKLIELLRKV
jgi:queuine tRNA-ribosyltransferase